MKPFQDLSKTGQFRRLAPLARRTLTVNHRIEPFSARRRLKICCSRAVV